MPQSRLLASAPLVAFLTLLPGCKPGAPAPQATPAPTPTPTPEPDAKLKNYFLHYPLLPAMRQAAPTEYAALAKEVQELAQKGKPKHSSSSF